MKVINSICTLNSETYTALGFFDGVHLGHRAVISEAVRRARELDIKSCVFTFSRRPKSILTGELDMSITTDSEKLELMDALGVDIMYIVDFADIMSLTGEEFVRDILINNLKCRGVVCGFNYHFGRGGKGDSTKLSELCKGFECEVISKPPTMYNGEAVSSSRIRAALQAGDIHAANDMLGRRYGYKLEVVHGRQLGRTIGIPTINQIFPQGFCLPKFGVYVSTVSIDGREYRGVTNIGVKPTVGSECPLSETWVLDFSGDLYGKLVDVRLISFIRGERKFTSVEELREQIIRDSEYSKSYDRK